MDIFQEIQNRYLEFSEKEKKIATYLLQNSDNIKNINISKLAALTESSPATITRFAKRMNCDSFVDLKIKLNTSSREKIESEPQEKADHVYQFYTKVIENTRQTANKKRIKEAVELIQKSARILVFGVGSSGLTATELTHRLVRMGINATAITDPHFMLISSAIATHDDLVIGISTSGETVEVVNSLKLAKKTGAQIISFSGFPNSKVSQLGDISLISYHSQFVGKERFINSQFAIMYVIDVMSTLLLENQEYSHKMTRTIDVITKSLEE